MGQARVYAKRADYPAAEAKLRRCIEMREALPQTDAYGRGPLAELYSELGALHLARGDASAALGPLQKAVRLEEDLVAAAPKNFTYVTQLAATYERAGWALRKLGQTQDALAHYQRALPLREQAASDELNGRARKQLAACREEIAKLRGEL